MRRTEAARYARWSVTVAALLAVMVVGVYSWRAWDAKQAQGTAPPPVPAAVQQRSAEFTYSKVEGNRTRFIVRASHTTEFKDGGRTLLEDVWITTFGGNTERFDQLHTAVCEYFANSATVTCPEQVTIDLQNAKSADSSSEADRVPAQSPSAVHIVTSHLSFNRESGMATSEDSVEFRFARGEGRAVGLNYDSQRGELHLLSDVEIVFRVPGDEQSAPDALATSDPMSITSGDLVYRRDERAIYLNGAATMRHGRQELQAGQMTLNLDDDMRTRHLIARDHPVLHNPNGDSDVSLSGDELVAPLDASGRPERVLASGHVILSALRSDGAHQLTANSSTLDLIPDSQQPRHFTASGNVIVQSTLQGGSMRRLQTSQLEVYFVSASKDEARVDRATGTSATIDWDSSARGSSRQDGETMRIQGQLLDGSFDESGALRELRGNGGVEVQRRQAGGPPMTSTSRELLAQMAPDGQWSTVNQSGEVRLKNVTGDARGDRAHFDRAGDSVTLTGSVVLNDASSQTRARVATFRQSVGELRAEGDVSTTELSPARAGASGDTKFQPTHISSERMVGNTAMGRAVYSGKARMWQGDSIIQADTIDLDRLKHTLIATGNASAVFPQSRQNEARTQGKPGSKAAIGSAAPRFLRAEAGRMIYEEDQHRARLEQGARTRSDDGSMRADRMDLFFTPKPGAGVAAAPKSGSPTGTGLGSTLSSQELQRAQGFGSVQVESAGRTGTGERADYSAADGKFVLSGGRPKLIDEFGNSTAGRQLTFYFSDDRIVVDSEEGSQSRTLTLHRVEK